MHSEPTSQPLPPHIDAVKLCQQGGSLSGEVSFVRLERLAEQLCHQNGQARVDWQFELDAQSRKVIHGTVDAVVPLVCQRCLEQVDVAVRADDVDEASAESARQQAAQVFTNQSSELDYSRAAAQLAEAVAQIRTIQQLRKKLGKG